MPVGASPSQTPANGVEYLEVTFPNGSERLVVGSTYTITWTGTVSDGLVKIEYSSSRDSGGNPIWSVFKTSTPNDGSEVWTVPNIPSAFCLVRVSDATDGSPFDTSDGPFRVEPMGSWPLITTINAGEVRVSFEGGDSAADSEIGFGYASATAPPQNRYILFQGLPDNPNPSAELSLGFMPVGSELDFYVITLGQAAYSGNRPNETFSDINGDHGYGDTAVTVIPGVNEAYMLHLDRCTGGIDDDNDFLIRIEIVPSVESPPVAVVQTPAGVQSGNVIISYTLKDAQGDECWIQVQFSEDGGLNWEVATPGPGGDGTQNLTSSSTGQNHVFVWNSVADIGQTRQDDIQIRITPFQTKDGRQGTASSTANFTVDNVPPPVLSCSPGSLSFEAMEGGPNPPTQVLEVWNSGGGVMDWRVTTNDPWLTLAPISGQSAGERRQVRVSVSVTGLSQGAYWGQIRLSCVQLPGITLQIPVTLTILERSPRLSVSPDILNFSTWEGGENPPSQNLEIQNTGGKEMPWQVSEWVDRTWLTLSPQSGSSGGEVDTVVVSVDVTGLPIGSYDAHIQVTAPGADGSPQLIPVHLDVTEPPPLLSVSPATIVFDCVEMEEDPPPQYVVIRNVGSGEFSWEVSDDAGWLSVSPPSGSNSGEPDTVLALAGIAGLSPETYHATITVTADTINSPQQVDVTLVVREKPPTLSVSPARLDFSTYERGENPSPQVLSVRNSGRGEMDWRASEKEDRVWLEFSPREGTSAGEADAIEVLVDVAGLTAGTYAAHIVVTSVAAVNSPVEIPVLLEIRPTPPLLSITPEDLTFAGTEGYENPPAQKIEIRNVGTGQFTWELSDDAAWLFYLPTSGTTAGETDTVEVWVDITGLSVGTYNATITVGGTANNAPQVVSVTLTVAEAPPASLEVVPLRLDFSAVEWEGNPPPQDIKVHNTGGKEMTWDVANDATWLSLLPESGSTGRGEVEVVRVSVDISGLSPGTHEATLTVTAPEAINSPQIVEVQLVIEANPPVLTVSPLSLRFEMVEGEAAPAPQSVTIRNEGGRTMEWQAIVEEKWLRVTPDSGANTGTPETVQVSVVSEGMDPGEYVTTIQVEAPGAVNSPQAVRVTFLIKAAKPEFLFSPESLNFRATRGGGNPPSQTFTITVLFYKEMTWQAEEHAEWLSLTPSSDTNRGEADVVTVSVNKAGLPMGTYEAEIVVGDVLRPEWAASVRVTLNVEPIRVPEDYPTIEAAMDAALEQDVIVVRAGTYREKFSVKPFVEVFGEGADRTVIDCMGNGTAVAFDGVDWARLEGFTIQGGTGELFERGDKVGGGIYIYQSSPLISNCRIVNNSAVWGGGICVDGRSAPAFIGCEIAGNSAVIGGGLFFYERSSATISTTKIFENYAEWDGGGLFLTGLSSASLRGCEMRRNQALCGGGAVHGASGCDLDIVSCTIAANSSPQGAAMFMEELSSVEVANTIVWGNASPILLLGEHLFRYCDLEESDLAGKNGNISLDPFFADPEGEDYHLLPCSPCVDKGSNQAAGLPATDLDGEARIMKGPIGALTDMGADELNPDVPVVLLDEISPGENGLVTVSYSLCHVLSLPCSVVVEYSVDGGREWHRITRAPQGEGTFGLSSSPAGEAHSFVWDSVADIGGVLAENVLLRITPEGEAKGKSRVGQPFSLRNTEIDTDNDKLLDAWEQTIVDANLQDGIRSVTDVFGGDDFDGDGTSNRNEYLVGTSPVDAGSCLRLVCTPGNDGEAVVSWTSATGRMYRLLYCDGLENGWRPLGETVSGTGTWIEFRDKTARETVLRFYRIEAE